MARIVELQRKLADGQDTLGHALASSLRQAYEDRRRLQLQADCAAGDTNGHITDEYGDCVHWCPKCGTPCEHGNNSLECQECRDVDKLTVAPDGVSLETLHRCMPPDAPLLPAPSFDQAIGRFQQWLRNNHDDRRFVVSGVNYKAVTRPDGVLDSHGMAALMSALADLEEWDPSRSGQPVGEAASQFLRHAYARISELEERSEKRSEDVPDGAPERVCVFQKAGWQHYGWTDHNMQVVLDVDGSDMGLEEARYIRADVHDRICDAWAESDKRLKGLIAERDERVETDRRALRAVVNSACEQFKVLVEASKKATIPMTNKRGIGDAMNNLRDALEKVAQNLEGNGEN
jgi:hypothetical protein